MRITSGEKAMLGRRAAQPTKEPGELLAIFCAGWLINPLNASGWMWQKRVRYARQWKERVALSMLEADRTFWPASAPKRVTFTASTYNRMDSDGLQAALKPVRDAMIECGVIHSDAPNSGHEFLYAQKIDRARRGVEIRARLR